MRGAVAQLATFGLLAGCGLARWGLEVAPVAGDDAGAPDSSTAQPNSSDATVSGTGPDASPGSDAAPGPGDDAADTAEDASAPDATDAADAAACPPPGDGGVTVAMRIAPAPKIDGDLSDWGCGPWTSLNDKNAGYVVENGQRISGQYAIRWDDNAVYVAAHIVVPTLQGNDGTNPYNNDAIELYVSGDSPLTGDYDKSSHQYIVDWHDLAVDYGTVHYPPNQSITSPPHLTSKTKQVSDGWQVEVAIGWPALVNGKAPTAGASIGFDVQLDDGDGVTLNTQLLETLATHSMNCGCQTCCCGQTNDLPNCDTLAFGGVTLQ